MIYAKVVFVNALNSEPPEEFAGTHRAMLQEIAVTSGRSLEEASSAAVDFARASKSDATRRAYQADAANFVAWCRQHALEPLPASVETIAAYLASLARSGLKASTITRRCAGIRHMHRMAGFEPPTSSEAIKAVLSGIRRSIGTSATRKAPATADAVRCIIGEMPDDLRGLRDRAILLLGFAGALRRSELVALDVSDLEETPEGLLVRIRRSKTDQEGAGDFVSIPHGSRLRPVAGVKAWLQAAGITEGPNLPLDQERRLSDSGKALRSLRGSDHQAQSRNRRFRSESILGPQAPRWIRHFGTSPRRRHPPCDGRYASS
jgi:integrase